MVTVEHWIPSAEPVWGQDQVQLHLLHTHEAGPTLTFQHTWPVPSLTPQVSFVGSVHPPPGFCGLCFWRLVLSLLGALPASSVSTCPPVLRAQVSARPLPSGEYGSLQAPLPPFKAWRQYSLWGPFLLQNSPGLGWGWGSLSRTLASSLLSRTLPSSGEHFLRKSLARKFSCQGLLLGNLSSNIFLLLLLDHKVTHSGLPRTRCVLGAPSREAVPVSSMMWSRATKHDSLGTKSTNVKEQASFAKQNA